MILTPQNLIAIFAILCNCLVISTSENRIKLKFVSNPSLGEILSSTSTGDGAASSVGRRMTNGPTIHGSNTAASNVGRLSSVNSRPLKIKLRPYANTENLGHVSGNTRPLIVKVFNSRSDGDLGGASVNAGINLNTSGNAGGLGIDLGSHQFSIFENLGGDVISTEEHGGLIHSNIFSVLIGMKPSHDLENSETQGLNFIRNYVVPSLAESYGGVRYPVNAAIKIHEGSSGNTEGLGIRFGGLLAGELGKVFGNVRSSVDQDSATGDIIRNSIIGILSGIKTKLNSEQRAARTHGSSFLQVEGNEGQPFVHSSGDANLKRHEATFGNAGSLEISLDGRHQLSKLSPIVEAVSSLVFATRDNEHSNIIGDLTRSKTKIGTEEGRSDIYGPHINQGEGSIAPSFVNNYGGNRYPGNANLNGQKTISGYARNLGNGLYGLHSFTPSQLVEDVRSLVNQDSATGDIVRSNIIDDLIGNKIKLGTEEHSDIHYPSYNRGVGSIVPSFVNNYGDRGNPGNANLNGQETIFGNAGNLGIGLEGRNSITSSQLAEAESSSVDEDSATRDISLRLLTGNRNYQRIGQEHSDTDVLDFIRGEGYYRVPSYGDYNGRYNGDADIKRNEGFWNLLPSDDQYDAARKLHGLEKKQVGNVRNFAGLQNEGLNDYGSILRG